MRARILFAATFCCHGACLAVSSYSGIDTGGSVIVVRSANVPADGQPVEVAVVVRRRNGQPIPGLSVRLEASAASVSQPLTPTDAEGRTVGFVSSTNLGLQELSAKVTMGDFSGSLNARAVMTFFALNTAGQLGLGTPLNAGPMVVYDSRGRIDVTYRGTVHFSSTDPRDTLPGDYTFSLDDHGVRTLANAVRLNAPGVHTVRATDLSTGAELFNQSFTVASPADSTLASATATLEPAVVQSGDSVTLTITPYDQYGFALDRFAGIGILTSSDPQALLPSTLWFDPNRNTPEQLLSSLQMRTVGDHFVLVNIAGALGNRITCAASVKVTPSPVAGLRLQSPSNVLANRPVDVHIEAVDAFGNRVPGYTGGVDITVSDVHAQAPARCEFTEGDASSKVLDNALTWQTIGVQTLHAVDPVANLSGDLEVFVSGPPLRLLEKDQTCLDSGVSDGAALFLRQCDGAPTQQWQSLDGQLRNAAGFCIDDTAVVENRQLLSVAACSHRRASQVWDVQISKGLIYMMRGTSRCIDNSSAWSDYRPMAASEYNPVGTKYAWHQLFARPGAAPLRASADLQQCLVVNASGQVHAESCSGAPSQNWTWQNGQLMTTTSRCLSTAPPQGVEASPCDDAPTQLWTYDIARQQLRPRNTPSRCLSLQPDGEASVLPCLGTDATGYAAQAWFVSGRTVKPSRNATLCLDTVDHSLAAGAQLNLQGCNAAATQTWQFAGGLLQGPLGMCASLPASGQRARLAPCNMRDTTQAISADPGGGGRLFMPGPEGINLTTNVCLEPVGGVLAAQVGIQGVTCNDVSPAQETWALY